MTTTNEKFYCPKNGVLLRLEKSVAGTDLWVHHGTHEKKLLDGLIYHSWLPKFINQNPEMFLPPNSAKKNLRGQRLSRKQLVKVMEAYGAKDVVNLPALTEDEKREIDRRVRESFLPGSSGNPTY
jgi:hypothetical protein